MDKFTTRISVLFVTVLLLWLIACSDRTSAPTAGGSGPTPPATSATAQPAGASNTAKGVIFTATPNPIQVCDGSGLGMTLLNWKAPGVGVVEVHVNTPDGPLLGRGGSEGVAQAHKWVVNSMVFYLQDVSGGAIPTTANTIGTLTVNLTTAGCP